MLAALDDARLGQIVQRVPLGRVGDPTNWPPPVEFLVSGGRRAT